MKMQIKQFSELTGVSVRTLHYYDEIGLLPPAETDRHSGYRYYDEHSFLRMQEILFFRELEFPLQRIFEILSSPDYDKDKALAEQKRLLLLKKERLERLISAVDDAMKGELHMSKLQNKELEQYQAEAKARWGKTAAYAEYTEKSKDRTKDLQQDLLDGMDAVLGKFAACMQAGNSPETPEAQALVRELQQYITEHFYHCTDEILAGLGQMYVADERFRQNIDRHAPGTAAYISSAIRHCCGKSE